MGNERSSAHAALMNYQQADIDGVMVTVSRQAIHEVSDEIEKLKLQLQHCSCPTNGGDEFQAGQDY